MSARAPSPLAWLGALLAAYLLAPIVAFLVRLGHGVPSAPGLGGAVVTSVLTASISTAIIALLGVPLAYVLARARGRLAAALSVLVALPLALPPLMSGILLLYLVGPYTALGGLTGGRLTDTRAGIVIAQTFVAAPFLVVAARGAFAAVDPELEDVARTLGHGRLARFWRVALPVAAPGVQAGLLLAWLRAFGEFGATVILAYHPYSLPVFTFVQFDGTGLPSTLLPVASALGVAIVVLGAVQVHARRRRPRARLPAPTAPAAGKPAVLRMRLRFRVGDMRLHLSHQAASPRLALLGPSGAGKTITLRLLAGIMAAHEAEVWAGDERLSGRAPEQRGIGYLPQHSALLPNRTVWQQVTFAVDAAPGLARWWADALGLTGLEDRYPRELSGGQQRRVALARALARRPALVLLDEPFSGLDAPVRAGLYRELRRLQREAGLSTVLVTHDPEEAALLADEIIVLDGGRVLQQGPVGNVFERPASARVAALLGLPNTFDGQVRGPGRLESDGVELAACTGDVPAGQPVTWTISPRDVRLDSGGPYCATVVDALALGTRTELAVRLGDLELRLGGLTDLPRPGERCQLSLPPEAIRLWPTVAPPQPAQALLH